jgi:uncharacterized protein with von Willebrand factor type A (vWA) domain
VSGYRINLRAKLAGSTLAANTWMSEKSVIPEGVTGELEPPPQEAATTRTSATAARRVADWAGGTRLGEGLRAFNERWGVGGMARGAVVVILSDGWDRGDPALLEEQMARLSRVAYKIVWVNPLKASPGYAPLAQGMAAALPYCDLFLPAHSLSGLRDLFAALDGRATPRLVPLHRLSGDAPTARGRPR